MLRTCPKSENSGKKQKKSKKCLPIQEKAVPLQADYYQRAP
jgi:hypothetical protein